MAFLLASICVLVIGSLWFVYRKNAKNYNLPPTPPGHWLLGNARMFPKPGKPLHPFLVQMNEQYGPIVRLRILNRNVIVISDAEPLKQVFFGKDFEPALGGNFTEGLGKFSMVSLRGDLWKRHRKLASSVLHSTSTLKTFIPVMTACTDELVGILLEKCKDGRSVDVCKCIKSFALDVMAKTNLDYNLNIQKEDNTPLQTAMTDTIEYIRATSFKPSPTLYKLLHPSILTRLKKARFVLEELADKIMKSRPHNPSKISMVSLLMDTEEQGLNKFEPQEIKDEIISFMFGGSDTTGSTLGWILYRLAIHADCQQRAYEEIKSVIGDRAPTYEDIERMPYINGVMKESQRLEVVASGALRLAAEDTKLLGYDIPKKSIVIINNAAIHRSPKYFPNPDEFKPERWIEAKDQPNDDLARFKFMPFGNGYRVCPGQRFAETEMKVAIVRILQQASFSLDTTKPFHSEQQIVNSPTEMYLRVQART